jgi:hypothetical protein
MKISRMFLTLVCCSFMMGAVAVAQYQTKPSAQGRAAQPPQEQYPSQGQYPAQDQGPSQDQQAPPYQAAPAAPPVQAREWVPDGIAALGQYATSRTEFTLDHSMLVLATKLDQDNQDLRRVIAGVNGVSVHSFRFPERVYYDPAAIGAISQQYRQAGWQHMVSKHRREDGPVTTDLWIHVDHAAISDIAVLFVGVKQLNFVSVSGSISPLDLLRLSGHFGIPRMDGGAMVPDRDHYR